MAFNFVQASSQDISRSSAPVTAPPLTMACWFRNTGTGTNWCSMSLGSSTSDDAYIMTPYDDRHIYFESEASGVFAPDCRTTTLFSLNTWSHGACVTSSTTSRTVYLNGGGSATETTLTAPANINVTGIGSLTRSGNKGHFMGGDVAEAGVWNAALDAMEVAALAKGVSPVLVRPSKLVFYWPGVRTAALDLRGAPLTATNTPTVSDHPMIMRPKAYRGYFAAAAAAASPIPRRSLMVNQAVNRSGTY